MSHKWPLLTSIDIWVTVPIYTSPNVLGCGRSETSQTTTLLYRIVHLIRGAHIWWLQSCSRSPLLYVLSCVVLSKGDHMHLWLGEMPKFLVKRVHRVHNYRLQRRNMLVWPIFCLDLQEGRLDRSSDSESTRYIYYRRGAGYGCVEITHSTHSRLKHASDFISRKAFT